MPAARDSGKRVGNNRRMRGGNKVLKKVLYQSAFSCLRHHETSRAFYERKRREGKRHSPALLINSIAPGVATSRPKGKRPAILAAHPSEHRQLPGGAPELRVAAQAVHRLVEPPPIPEPNERLTALPGTIGRLSTPGAMPTGPEARPVAAGALLALVPEALN